METSIGTQLEEVMQLVGKLGTQDEQKQDDIIRDELHQKISGIVGMFQEMEEKLASLENLVAFKDSQLKAADETSSDSSGKGMKNAELNIRLELEHDRRVRAQEAIGEIEKERIVLKQKLDLKNSDYEQKAQEFDEVKLGCDYKVAKIGAEMKKLEQRMTTVTSDKDRRIHDLQATNSELCSKLEAFEEKYNNQLDISRTLQNELQASIVETQSLIKEMEMLNMMFAELEQHIVSQQCKDHGDIEVNENGKIIKVNEVLAAAQSTKPTQSILQESCFNEVTTKHGTKMVLSVSKTFLKLKDLILEKNTLKEQVTKMKNINEHLCSQVNLHEEKLCGITDELNNTWFYVSKIKEQHKKLHSAEQILKAELAEKRAILKGLRKELEESRDSWNSVKAKTAESELQWVKLKADFAENRRLLMSSSESGISDMETSTSQQADIEKGPTVTLSAIPLEEDDEDEISEEIPDPFSDDEDADLLNNNVIQAMVPSISSLVNVEIEEEEEEEPLDTGLTPIFVPSLSYLAEVPSQLQTSMLASGKPMIPSSPADGSSMRDRVEDSALEEVDDNVRDLITRLSSSTARGAFLANRLADIHRRIATGTSLTDHNEWFEAEEEETDIEPRETEYEDDTTAASPSLLSEVEDVHEEFFTASSSLQPCTSTPIPGQEDNSRSSSPDSLVLAIDEAINILDPPRPIGIPLALASPQSNVSFPFGPLHNAAESVPLLHRQDEDEDVEELFNDEGEGSQETQDDGSAAVTRYLIKHLPKQLTQLREEKHQLEDKIHDLELVVSEQRMQMAEHERRVDEAVNATAKMEEKLKRENGNKNATQTKENGTGCPSEKEMGATFRVPVEVEQQDMLLTWTVECREERPCCFWLNYIPAGGNECDAVILPCRAEDTTPMDPQGLRSTLQVECGHKGRYTLHIEGSGNRLPHVTVSLIPAE